VNVRSHTTPFQPCVGYTRNKISKIWFSLVVAFYYLRRGGGLCQEKNENFSNFFRFFCKSTVNKGYILICEPKSPFLCLNFSAESASKKFLSIRGLKKPVLPVLSYVEGIWVIYGLPICG
jgi:hypothetical protein